MIANAFNETFPKKSATLQRTIKQSDQLTTSSSHFSPGKSHEKNMRQLRVLLAHYYD